MKTTKSLSITLLLAAATVIAQSPDSARIDKLETGVERAEALRSLKRLQYTFNHYLDLGLWNDLADLVTDNATADFGSAKPKGKAEVKKHYMDEALRTAPGLADGQLNTHLLMQPIVNLGPDGKTAKGCWHELQMLGKYNDKAMWVGGIYENDYVLDNGKWKISNIHFYEQYRGLYEEPGQKGTNVQVPYHFTGDHVGLTIPASALQPIAGKGDPSKRLATLSSRLQEMDDENTVRNLQHAYGYYLDRKMWDDAAELFTQDHVAQIRRDLEAKYGAPKLKYGELFDHLNFGTIVAISPDGLHAAARTTELAQIGLNNEYARWELGVYEDEFVKDKGTWKIAALHYYPRMITDYEKGWAKDFRPEPKFSSPKFHNLKSGLAKPATKSIGELEIMLAQAIGVDAVENLNSSYGYYLDDGSWDDMANTFGLKGAKEITGAGVYAGSDKIRAILKLRGSQGVGRNPTSYTIHQLIQPVIHISADGLSANARLRLFQGGGRMDGTNSSWIGGIYENTAFFESGEWKFGRQDLHHMFNASYKNGWAKFAPRPAAPPKPAATPAKPAAPGAAQAKGKAPSLQSQIAPDYPIRAPQYQFPTITEPAFHYKNPVSGRAPGELLP